MTTAYSRCAAILLAVLSPLLLTAADFAKDIKPILDAHCLECHGPDKQKSELRVDKRAIMLIGGDSGLPSIVPGSPEKSFLIEAIKGIDPDALMPPKKSEDPLSPAQIALLETWIADGADWPGQMADVAAVKGADHWAFQAVTQPAPPSTETSPIDAFLIAALAKAEIVPNPPADARSLIRRAAIVLTGLPPTPERVANFAEHFAKDADSAYDALVDELLASPHFGERWAQHWLDVIRWAETNGSESNLYRKNAWIYRDYVIRAFNEDTPYDRFVREQIAGDSLDAGEATGFLVAGPHVPAATVGREPSAIRQARADRMDEVVQTIGASVMGMTMGCARCHNHKFDPISISDYYAMTAAFQDIEFGSRFPELSEDHPRRQRGQELWRGIAKQRGVLRPTGPWEEDWGGFKEMHFAATEAHAVRVTFMGNARLDELQIFGSADRNANLALDAEVQQDITLQTPNTDIKNINDGNFGTMAWAGKGKDGKKPWVTFRFAKPQMVSRINMSSNREYFFGTDYVQVNRRLGFSNYRVEVQDAAGEWREVAFVPKINASNKKQATRKAAIEALQEQIHSLLEEGPRPSFLGRFVRPVVTHVFHRGSPENPRDEVAPAAPAILAGDLGLSSKTSGRKRRAEFAKWITGPDNPLTARVMANRLWHHTFGSGIVPTPSDFGAAGAPPTHPELLDWLAAEFAKTWSMKGYLRMLVTSDAFRRSSLPSDDGLGKDASAALLWRFPPRRIEAEVIRDAILQASGKLDPRLGGRSFRIHNVKKTYAQWEVVDNHGPETWRRMIYQERMRRVDDKIFTAFDFPDCGQIRAKRPVSTTPLQALNLMNSDFVVEQAQHLVTRAGDVRQAFQLLLARQPDPDELAACEGVSLELVCRSLINSNEFAFLP